MFRFKDDFLINLSFMPIKEQLTYSKVIYNWEQVTNTPIIIFNTKEHSSYRFFITYKGKKSGNIMVLAEYEGKSRIMKYNSLLRGHFKYFISDSYSYKYDIGHTEKEWEVVQHTRNNHGGKRYVLKDLTVKDERFLEIDESKLLSRGFPKQKKKLKDISHLYNKVTNNKYLDYYVGSSKRIKCFCNTCGEIVTTEPRYITLKTVNCVDCTNAISFPERVMQSVLEDNNIEYDREVIIKELNNKRIDFVVNVNNRKEFIEVNGAQHYIKDHRWYGHSIKSDNEKKEYAKENNIPIYFIDARKSDIDYISQSIDKEIDYIKINKDNIVKILERRNISLQYIIVKHVILKDLLINLMQNQQLFKNIMETVNLYQ